MAVPPSNSCWRVPPTDSLQRFLLLLCLFDLAFFCYYLFYFEIDKQNTISDTLLAVPHYAIILTILLTMRALGGILFLIRFRNQHPRWEIAGFCGVLTALAGWGVLVACHDTTRHFTGVGFFCLGSFVYSLAFVRLAATTEERLEMVHAIMEAFLLMSVAALVVSFVSLWAEEERDGKHDRGSSSSQVQNAYIVEHAAYIVHLLFYASFFLYHTPDIENIPGGHVGEGYEETDPDVEGTPMVCRPLIFQERLPVILEKVKR